MNKVVCVIFNPAPYVRWNFNEILPKKKILLTIFSPNYCVSIVSAYSILIMYNNCIFVYLYPKKRYPYKTCRNSSSYKNH